MNNMKRLIAVMMVLALALCFAACTQPQQTPSTTTTQKPAPSSSSTAPTTPSEPEEPDYIVYVVDQDGNAVIGADVTLCDDSMCLPGTVEENGAEYFLFKALKGAAKAKVTDVPDGYTIDPVDDPEGYTYFAEGENTVTLRVTKTAE